MKRIAPFFRSPRPAGQSLYCALPAAITWGFASSNERLPRQSDEDIAALTERTGIGRPMREFGAWEHRAAGERGRHH